MTVTKELFDKLNDKEKEEIRYASLINISRSNTVAIIGFNLAIFCALILYISIIIKRPDLLKTTFTIFYLSGAICSIIYFIYAFALLIKNDSMIENKYFRLEIKRRK